MTDTTNCCESHEVQLLLPNKTFWFAVVNGGCCSPDCAFMDTSEFIDRCVLFDARVNHARCIECHEAAARYEGYRMAKMEVVKA